MKSNPKKTGRKAKPYLTSWGETINGLRRDAKSGRWFIHGGGNFREQDERLAVARFRATESRKKKKTKRFRVDYDARKKLTHIGPATDGSENVIVTGQSYFAGVKEDELWAYVREQLIERPAWVAERVGIEQISYLSDLPKPKAVPTLDEVGKFLQDRSESSKQQKEQLAYWWSDFKSFCLKKEVSDLKGIDTELAFQYAAEIKSRELSPRYKSHWLSGIKTNVSFGLKHGLNPTSCRVALDALMVMRPPKKSKKRKASHPIDPKDWHAIHQAMPTDRDKAIWLCMLNFAMYPKEAVALNWEEIDLEKETLVTDRDKTDILRVAVLWPQTVEALKALTPKESGPVFLTIRGSRLTRAAYAKLYRVVRSKAKVDGSVKMEDCRDGAQQAAIDAGADVTMIKLLAGHSIEMTDNYIMRKPTLVAGVCQAIEAFYFV